MLTNEWIPCAERLPEKSYKPNVLVYVPPREGVRQSGIKVGHLEVVEADPEGKKNVWGIPREACEWSLYGWSYFEHPIVTHWMPLPEPPKEG